MSSEDAKSSSEILNELFSTFNSKYEKPKKKSKDKKVDKKQVKKLEKKEKKKLEKKLKQEKKKKKVEKSKKKTPKKNQIVIGDGFVVLNKSVDVEDGEIVDKPIVEKKKRKRISFDTIKAPKLSASQAYKLDTEETRSSITKRKRVASPEPYYRNESASHYRTDEGYSSSHYQHDDRSGHRSRSPDRHMPRSRSPHDDRHMPRSRSPHDDRHMPRSRSPHDDRHIPRSRSPHDDRHMPRSRSPHDDRDRHRHHDRSHERPSHSSRSSTRLAPPRESYRSSYERFQKQRDYSEEPRSSRSYDYYDYATSRRTTSSGFGYVNKSYYYDEVEQTKRSYYHPDDIVDKAKLLEIARKNATKLLHNGVLPSDIFTRDQMIAIKAGGKNIEELTNYCKVIATRDAQGDAYDDEQDSSFIHHPFVVKDKPLPTITMNIRNSVPLPVRSAQELAIDGAKLRTQFPVSSGTQHRVKEIDWKPVASDKSATIPTATVAPMVKEDPTENPDEEKPKPTEPLAIEAPPADDSSNTIDPLPDVSDVDISNVIGLRLKAMRMLQENPANADAISQLDDATKMMKTWADAKALEPKFLTVAELSSGPQAWAKRDQLRKTNKLDSGMGMHLLQKMGWRPGEGLGKNKEGQLEPLALDVKTDKKGLTAAVEELMYGSKTGSKGTGPSMPVVYDLSGKHPVSALMELTAKRRWGSPEFALCFEHGPPHQRQFVYKVIVNGVEYQPCVAVGNKKQAKANAAAFCLQSLGLLPPIATDSTEQLQTVPDTPGTIPPLNFSNPTLLKTVDNDCNLMPPPKPK